MKKRSGRPSASLTACSLVFMPPLVRPIRRPLWSLGPPFSTAGWSPCGVPSATLGGALEPMALPHLKFDDHRLRNGCLGGQAIHHPGEDSHVAPPIPAIVEGLRRASFLGCIAPAQAIAIDEDNAVRARRSSTRGLPWLLGKTGCSCATCASVSQKRLLIVQSPCGG